MTNDWYVVSGVERNREYPESFGIPSDEEKNALVTGDIVKICIEAPEEHSERFWCILTSRLDGARWLAEVNNDLVGPWGLSAGDSIEFHRDAIIDISDHSVTLN